tara:strand:+ start:381 stop:566 length:186 start_codon:yes stop_codon:yes gene_type:complete
MCIICIEYQKQKLTVKEALRNLLEMKPQIDETHYWEVYNKLNDDQDEMLLEEWWEEFGFGD